MKQFILFAITLIYSTALLAQTRPALFGKVVNAEGENIEYANVVVTDEHNLTIASTSVSNGNFTINTKQKTHTGAATKGAIFDGKDF